MKVGRVLLVFLLFTGALVASENPDYPAYYPGGSTGKWLVGNTSGMEKWMGKNRMSGNNPPLRRGGGTEHSGTISDMMDNHRIFYSSEGASAHTSLLENPTPRFKAAVNHPLQIDDPRMLSLATDNPNTVIFRRENRPHPVGRKMPLNQNRFYRENNIHGKSSFHQNQTNHSSSPRLTSSSSLAQSGVRVRNRSSFPGESDSLLNRTLHFALFPNYPNPFNQSTTIRFTLFTPVWVTLEVFNLLGQSVRTLIDRKLAAGSHAVEWDGCSKTGLPVPSGVYFYRLKAGRFVQIRRMILIR